MSDADYVCPPCRLAARGGPYEDEHARCSGTVEVRLPGDPPGQAPIERLHCACADRDHQPPS